MAKKRGALLKRATFHSRAPEAVESDSVPPGEADFEMWVSFGVGTLVFKEN